MICGECLQLQFGIAETTPSYWHGTELVKNLCFTVRQQRGIWFLHLRCGRFLLLELSQMWMKAKLVISCGLAI